MNRSGRPSSDGVRPSARRPTRAGSACWTRRGPPASGRCAGATSWSQTWGYTSTIQPPCGTRRVPRPARGLDAWPPRSDPLGSKASNDGAPARAAADGAVRAVLGEIHPGGGARAPASAPLVRARGNRNRFRLFSCCRPPPPSDRRFGRPLPQRRESTAQHFDGDAGGNFYEGAAQCAAVNMRRGPGSTLHPRARCSMLEEAASCRDGRRPSALAALVSPRSPRSDAEVKEFRNRVTLPLLREAGIPVLPAWAATQRLGASQARPEARRKSASGARSERGSDANAVARRLRAQHISGRVPPCLVEACLSAAETSSRDCSHFCTRRVLSLRHSRSRRR